MTILVTGGGGFLGRSIIRALRDRGEQVRSFARGDYAQLRDWGVEQVRGDIGDSAAVSQAVAGCDAVFHTAARVEMWGPYEEFFRVNTLGTHNVIEACRAHEVRKLIYTSTPSVVHGGDSVSGLDESAPYPTHFEAHYPATKALAEQEVLAANCETLATVAIRPHLVWGPGDTSMMPRVVAKARQGRVRLIGPPQRVDTLYIDNAVAAHLAAWERLQFGVPPAGRAYFVTQGEPLSGQQFLNDLLTANGLAPVDKRVSVGLARTIASIVEVIWRMFRLRGEPPLTRFVVSQLSTAHWYDISAARRDLGYVPTVSYAEGMRRLRASLGDPAFPLPHPTLVLGRASQAQAQAYLSEVADWRARAQVWVQQAEIATELRQLLDSQLAGHRKSPRAASLGLFAQRGVAESSQYPDTASFRLLALDENPGAIRHDDSSDDLLGCNPAESDPQTASIYRLRSFPTPSDDALQSVIDVLVWRAAVVSCLSDIWDVIGPTPFDVRECNRMIETLFTPAAMRGNEDYCGSCFVTPQPPGHFMRCPIRQQVDGDRYAIWDATDGGGG